MKITAKLNDMIVVDVEGDSQTDCFEKLSAAQEIFGNSECQKCKSTDIKYVVRQVDDNKFYELHCNNCHAKLTFGLHKKGGGKTMFPHRKDDNGGFLPNNGWTIYVKPTT